MQRCCERAVESPVAQQHGLDIVGNAQPRRHVGLVGKLDEDALAGSVDRADPAAFDERNQIGTALAAQPQSAGTTISLPEKFGISLGEQLTPLLQNLSEGTGNLGQNIADMQAKSDENSATLHSLLQLSCHVSTCLIGSYPRRRSSSWKRWLFTPATTKVGVRP